MSNSQIVNEAIELLNLNEASCIAIKDNKIIAKELGRGIKPLFNIYSNYLEQLEGSLVVDKVIGKGAAILICNAKVDRVYTHIISQPALELLNKYNINIDYEVKTEHIKNRDNTGMCPLEKRVFGIEDLEEGLAEIRDFVNSLKN